MWRDPADAVRSEQWVESVRIKTQAFVYTYRVFTLPPQILELGPVLSFFCNILAVKPLQVELGFVFLPPPDM